MKAKTREEAKLERDVIKAFKEAGWYARHVDPSPGEAGFPDVLAICGDKYALVELKTKTTLRPSQKAWAKRHGNIILNRFVIEETMLGYRLSILSRPLCNIWFSILYGCIEEIARNCKDENEH